MGTSQRTSIQRSLSVLTPACHGTCGDRQNCPTGGGYYQATWSTYHDQETGHYSFERYEADATHYVPLGSDNWILEDICTRAGRMPILYRPFSMCPKRFLFIHAIQQRAILGSYAAKTPC